MSLVTTFLGASWVSSEAAFSLPFMEIRSTSKIRVELGPMFGGPEEPYAKSEGIKKRVEPPDFINCNPSVHPLMTPFSGKLIPSPLSNSFPSMSVPL